MLGLGEEGTKTRKVPAFIVLYGSKYSSCEQECHLSIPPYLLTYLFITYLLNPWSGVLLEKLTGSHLGKKFPTFYGTRRFITAFTNARQLSPS